MSEYSELPHVLQLLKEAALQQDGSPRKGYASSSPMVGYGETDIWAPRCSIKTWTSAKDTVSNIKPAGGG